jgi:hypothetical protein
LINKTYRLEPSKKAAWVDKKPYDLKISAKEFLSQQRQAAKIELERKETVN